MRQWRRSLQWKCAALAPQALVFGALISCAASASDLIGKSVRLASLASDWRFAERAQTLVRTRKLLSPHDALEPRPDLKQGFVRFPEVDRTLKGDQILALRPTISLFPAAERGMGALPAGDEGGPWAREPAAQEPPRAVWRAVPHGPPPNR